MGGREVGVGWAVLEGSEAWKEVRPLSQSLLLP